MITLNRPERLNAMDAAMLDALMQAVTQAEEDDAIRAVVVTGAGRGFSSGFDLKAQANNFDGDSAPSGGVPPIGARDHDSKLNN